MNAKTANDAKRYSSKKDFQLNDMEIKKWATDALDISAQICQYKYKTYPDIRKLLLDNTDSYILHEENRNRRPYWGGRINKKTGELIGENKLGKIWMDIRNEAKKTEIAEKYEIIEPVDIINLEEKNDFFEDSDIEIDETDEEELENLELENLELENAETSEDDEDSDE